MHNDCLIDIEDSLICEKGLTNLSIVSQTQSAQILRMYLLDHIRDRLEAGQMDFINEVRRLSVVFVGFPNLSYAAKSKIQECLDEDIQEVHSRFLEVQSTLQFFGGSLLQFRCDEKGFLAVCAFGFPGKGHKGIETRAIHSALDIVRTSGNTAVVGVATGNLLCAWVGSKSRAEYTVFGDAINLSARLMCKAKNGLGEVLCDEDTRNSVNGNAYVFRALDPLDVKGRSSKVQIYRVNSSRRRRENTSNTVRPNDGFVGRTEIMCALKKEVEDFLGSDLGGLVLIQGRKLTGKSAVLQKFQRRFYCSVEDPWVKAREDMKLFFGQGDDRESETIMHPWKNVLREMFVCARNLQQETTRTWVQELLKPCSKRIQRVYQDLFDVLVVDIHRSPKEVVHSTDLVHNSMYVSERNCGGTHMQTSGTRQMAPYTQGGSLQSLTGPSTAEDVRDEYRLSDQGHSSENPAGLLQEESQPGATVDNEIDSNSFPGIVAIAVELIKYFTTTLGPCIVLLEDIRKFDTVSLSIFMEVMNNKRLLGIVTMRSFEEHTHHAPSTVVTHSKFTPTAILFSQLLFLLQYCRYRKKEE